jgi:hypothetical protein
MNRIYLFIYLFSKFGHLLEPCKEIWQLFSGNHLICDKNFENFHAQNKRLMHIAWARRGKNNHEVQSMKVV